jgi:hypothetical protein
MKIHSEPWLVVRQPPTSKDMNVEAKESTALRAVTKQQPVKMSREDLCTCFSEL